MFYSCSVFPNEFNSDLDNIPFFNSMNIIFTYVVNVNDEIPSIFLYGQCYLYFRRRSLMFVYDGHLPSVHMCIFQYAKFV